MKPNEPVNLKKNLPKSWKNILKTRNQNESIVIFEENEIVLKKPVAPEMVPLV